MLNKNDIESLRLFNTKFDELNDTCFYSSALAWSDSHGGLMNMTLDLGKSITVDVFDPDNDNLKSFIMTYKVLTEKVNPCSLVKIAAIYAKLPENLLERGKFNGFRNDINSHLDSDSGLFENGIHWKRRQIVDNMINAVYAHVDLSKKEDVNRWLAEPVIFELFKHQFIETLLTMFDLLFKIRLLNDSVLNNKSFCSA